MAKRILFLLFSCMMIFSSCTEKQELNPDFSLTPEHTAIFKTHEFSHSDPEHYVKTYEFGNPIIESHDKRWYDDKAKREEEDRFDMYRQIRLRDQEKQREKEGEKRWCEMIGCEDVIDEGEWD